MKKQPKVLVGARISPELRDLLRASAEKAGVTVSVFINRILRAWMEVPDTIVIKGSCLTKESRAVLDKTVKAWSNYTE